MHKRSTDEVQRLLSRLDATEFAALLDNVAGPSEDVISVGLVDLVADREAALGDGAGPKPLLALAHDLCGAGDGAAMRALLAEHPAFSLWLDVAGHTVLMLPGPRLALVALRLSSRSDLRRLRKMCEELRRRQRDGTLLAAVQDMAIVDRVWCLDSAPIRVRDRAVAKGSPLQARWREAEPGLLALVGQIFGSEASSAISESVVDGVLLDEGDRYHEMRRIPFAPQLVVTLEAEALGGEASVWRLARNLAQDVLRELIGKILATGMETLQQPFPQTDIEFEDILGRLRQLSGKDLDERLRIGGFADHPVEGDDRSMRCRECIYFLPHRRWCDLPELPLPVEADWYCRLWKL